MSYDEATVGGRPRPEEEMYPGRRQLDSLTADDLETTGVWWFPGFDNHLSGPDDRTVMPVATDVAGPDGSVEFPDGRFLVRAQFTLADGSEACGHMTYAPDDAGSLRDREPTICTDGGQIPLWHGLIVPSDEQRAEYLRWLGRTAEQVFPLRWSAVFHPPGDVLPGSLDGFAVQEDGELRELR